MKKRILKNILKKQLIERYFARYQTIQLLGIQTNLKTEVCLKK